MIRHPQDIHNSSKILLCRTSGHLIPSLDLRHHLPHHPPSALPLTMSPPNTPSFIPPFAGAPATHQLTTRKSAVARTTLPISSPTLLPPRAVTPASAPALVPQTQTQPFASSFGRDPAGPAGGGVGIVLFRSDLRLDDHTALSQALEECSSIIPVFCFDPRHFGRTEHGFDKTGKYRARFLIDSVSDLRSCLQEKGSDLIVRVGKPEKVIPQLARSVGARGVYLHREVTFEEQQVEQALVKSLSGSGADAHMSWSNTLYHENDLPFALEDMPDVYSDFREAVEKKARIRTPVAAPDELMALPPGLAPGEIPTLSALGIAEIPLKPTYAGVSAARGGEREAFARLRAYVEDCRTVDPAVCGATKVNAHLSADFSCRISPWLALGCVSPRRIFHELSKAAVSQDMLLRSSTYFELVWRDFFRCVTAKYSNKRSETMSHGSTRSMSRGSTRRMATAGAV